MSSTEFIENGYQTKSELKQKFLVLTDSDLLLIEGLQDEILDKLHIRFGKTKKEILELISEA